MRIGHQQRQTEIAQQALGRAFPVARVVAQLEQLAGERHLGFVDPQGRTQRGAHGDLLRVDVAAPRFQAGDLRGQRLALLAPLRECNAGLVEFVLHRGLALGGGVLHLPAQRALRQKVFAALHAQQSERRPQRVVALRLGQAPRLLLLDPLDLGGQARDAVAPAVADRAAQFALVALLRRALLLDPRDLAGAAPQLFGQLGDALLQQTGLQPGEIALQRFTAGAQRVGVGERGGMLVAVGHQRREQDHLALGLEHRLVRAVQVVEVREQGLDARRRCRTARACGCARSR